MPLVYVVGGKLVEAPQGFSRVRADGALEPIPQFRSDKAYHLYGPEGAALGTVEFDDTVVTDRGYGNVDQSHVRVAKLDGPCPLQDERAGWMEGVITDYPLKANAPLASSTRDVLLQQASAHLKRHLEEKTKDAAVRQALLEGPRGKPQHGFTRYATIRFSAWLLQRDQPIVVAQAYYVDEVESSSQTAQEDLAEPRHGAAIIVAWAVVRDQWQQIFDESFEGEDGGAEVPVHTIEAAADLDGDGVAELVGHRSGGCDVVMSYVAGRLRETATSCNGYITE